MSKIRTEVFIDDSTVYRVDPEKAARAQRAMELELVRSQLADRVAHAKLSEDQLTRIAGIISETEEGRNA